MKTILLAAIAALTLGACAMQDAPTAADPVCGNDLCESGENHSSCPADCDAGPVNPTCGNDVCENGETAASCWEDCDNGDPTCRPESWAAYSVKDDMRFRVKSEDGSWTYCKGTPAGDGRYYATLVGDCAVEPADNGYPTTWTNGTRIYRNAGDAEWVYKRKGTVAQECHVNLRDCDNPYSAPKCEATWDNFLCPASPVAPGTEASGPYGWLGDYLGPNDESSEIVGHFAFQWNTGGAAEPRGILTCGP